MPSYLMTPPTAEPVSLGDARTALRIDDDRYDAELPGRIIAARRVAEHETGRRLMAQTWRYELDDWPEATDLLPEYDPTSVAVSYWNGSAWATLSASLYAWAPAGPARESIALAPKLGAAWPALVDVAIGPRVRIDVTSGATTAENVPMEARQFITALVGVMLADPTLTVNDPVGPTKYLWRLLDPLRLHR